VSLPVYKHKWQKGHPNTKFWTEVLVGRTIEELIWSNHKIIGVILDSGERVAITPTGHVGIATEGRDLTGDPVTQSPTQIYSRNIGEVPSEEKIPRKR